MNTTKRYFNTNVLSFLKKQLPISPILPIKENKNHKPPVNYLDKLFKYCLKLRYLNF